MTIKTWRKLGRGKEGDRSHSLVPSVTKSEGEATGPPGRFYIRPKRVRSTQGGELNRLPQSPSQILV